tara:strand:+ start:1202 stop:2371 length:1170 start_codon:yes stop_codon:yes gene_type:complete
MIPLAKPYLSDQEITSVASVIRSGWITQGPKVAEFEKAFAQYVGANHAVAVSNCTSGLHLALMALGIKENDEVITVSHSYIATANSIRHCGAIPLFVDIESDTFNINPLKVEASISDKTKAILCVHQMGMPCDIGTLLKISEKHKLPLIEDAACAVGSQYYLNEKWEQIGKPHGDIAVFSFHPRKIITTGDGGMITTNSKSLFEKFQLLRQHSMSISDLIRHKEKSVIFESYNELGYNYRLTDIQAAIGLVQLDRLDDIVEKRRKLADLYKKFLNGVKGIQLPEERTNTRTNWQSYCVRFDDSLSVHQIMQQLLEVGISSRRGILCAHLEPAYEVEPWTWYGKEEGKQVDLKESENARNHCIILPLFPEMKVQEIKFVCDSLIKILSNN